MAIAPQDTGISTLHVYETLIQIPVLVLDPLGTPLEPIDPRRFAISIDSGPRFRPSYVRLEGNDPISLSILLDARGPEDDLLPKIDAAIAGLAPLSLQARDQVSVYALDCTPPAVRICVGLSHCDLRCARYPFTARWHLELSNAIEGFWNPVSIQNV